MTCFNRTEAMTCPVSRKYDWKAIYSDCAATCADALSHRSPRAGIKPSSQNRRDHLVVFMRVVCAVRRVLFMRMRDLADVKL
jgi:hypothetical protein